MRCTPTVMVVALLSSSALAGCGATQTQRRNNAMLTAAAGATLLAVGLLVASSEDDDDCDDGSEGPSLCLDLVNENKVGGGLLAVTGGVLAFGGLGAFMVSTLPPPDRTSPGRAPAPVGDPAACVEWRQALDAETDPARRGALHAVRPAHCERPRP